MPKPQDEILRARLATVLVRGLETVLLRVDALRAAEDAEAAHGARVAIRRMRVRLDLLGSVLRDPEAATRAGRPLRRAFRRLSGLRETEVEIALLESLAPGGGDRRLRELVARRVSLADLRAGARREAEVFPRRRVKRRMRKIVYRLLSGACPAGATAVVTARLAALHGDLEDGAAALRRDGDPAAFHEVRMRSKKLRYALEAALDVLPAEAELPSGLRRASLAGLRRLQDRLGELHDVDVILGRLSAESDASELASALAPLRQDRLARALRAVRGFVRAGSAAREGRSGRARRGAGAETPAPPEGPAARPVASPGTEVPEAEGAAAPAGPAIAEGASGSSEAGAS